MVDVAIMTRDHFGVMARGRLNQSLLGTIVATFLVD